MILTGGFVPLKYTNMKKIEFTKDFATRKKGDKVEFDSGLANVLVNEKKVAKYITATASKKTS